MLREILDKLELRGKEFLAGRLYDVRWQRGYLKDRGIKGVIRVRRNGVGREDAEGGEYKERNKIEGLFGNMKMKYLDMLQCTGKIWKWCWHLLSFWCTTCM